LYRRALKDPFIEQTTFLSGLTCNIFCWISETSLLKSQLTEFTSPPKLPYPLWLPLPLFIKQNWSAHPITTHYLVQSYGLTEGHFFQLCQRLAISSAALQLDGNQTDSYTLNGGLDKVTTSANLQQWGCEILWLIQLTL
jgi:hypothetical protein